MLPIVSVEALLASLIQGGVYFKFQSLPLEEWYRAIRLEGNDAVAPEFQAVYGGFFSNSVGQAFINGYESAIQRLFAEDTGEHLAAVCVTENKSTRPADMLTTLSPREEGRFLLSGRKDFVTLAADATALFVAAKQEEEVVSLGEGDKNHIVMVRVPVSAPGVRIQLLDMLPFVPDVSHGSVTFDSVPIASDSVLIGDGYSDFVKPFRWFEDVGVFVSVASYLFKVALAFDWSEESKTEMLSLLSTIFNVQSMGATDAVGHLLMHDHFTRLDKWLECHEGQWAKVSPLVMKGWQRDRVILSIAQKARQVRYTRALGQLFG